MYRGYYEEPRLGRDPINPMLYVDSKIKLADHILKPVQWTASVVEMVTRGSAEFLEIGPGQVLSGLIRRISQDSQVVSLNDREVARVLTPSPLG